MINLARHRAPPFGRHFSFRLTVIVGAIVGAVGGPNVPGSAPVGPVTPAGSGATLVVEVIGMAGPGLAHLTIERGGATFASADVQIHGDIVDLHIDVAGGCASADARRELLIKIFALPTLHYARVVRAAIPFGDTELLFGLSERLADVHTRRAGATCLIDALLSETPRRPPAV